MPKRLLEAEEAQQMAPPGLPGGETPPVYMRPTDVAKKLGVDIQTIYTLEKQGLLHAKYMNVHQGRPVRLFHREEVARLKDIRAEWRGILTSRGQRMISRGELVMIAAPKKGGE